MTLLALDPATRCGYALAEPFSGGRPSIRCGSWALGSGTNWERAQELSRRLIQILKDEQITYAAVEIPQAGFGNRKVQKLTPLGFETEIQTAGNVKVNNLLWGLHGAIAAVFAGFRIPCRPVGVKEWRAHTLGNGNIGGVESKQRCKALLESMGAVVPNQDAAEAAGILLMLNGHLRHWQAEDQLRAA